MLLAILILCAINVIPSILMGILVYAMLKEVREKSKRERDAFLATR